jgi:hypothetical protein
MADLRNLNEMLDRIQGLAIRTTQGSFVKVEDLLVLFEEYQGENSLRQTEKYKTFDEARQAAMRDPELLAAFQGTRPKTEAQIQAAFGDDAPPTATEGVKP